MIALEEGEYKEYRLACFTAVCEILIELAVTVAIN